MKRIDMFVFIAGIVSTLIIIACMLIAINTNDTGIIDIGKYITCGIGLVIFARFMQDEYFKFKYYLGYFICATIVSSILQGFGIMYQGYIPNGNLAMLITIITIISLLESLARAFIFQCFKEMSYKKMNRLY